MVKLQWPYKSGSKLTFQHVGALDLDGVIVIIAVEDVDGLLKLLDIGMLVVKGKLDGNGDIKMVEKTH